MICERISLTLLLMLLSVSKSASQAKNYFQQEVNTIIHASLDTRTDLLHSFISIEYINNSSDSLEFLYFHLWPNAYSSNTTDLAKQIFALEGRQKLFKDERLKGYMDSLYFRVNGVEAEIEYIKPDICRIFLSNALYPGDTLIIETPFRVKIPGENISRMGVDNGVYHVSQWYPKPAVYDNDGWHPMSYLDQGEFFSEYGSYDVHITVPENFVVGGSGKLITSSELQWLENYASSWQPGHFEDVQTGKTKTLHFTSEHIHDFAWVAGKSFKIEKDSILLPGSGRKVITQVMYTPDDAVLWSNALEFVKRSLLAFSTWIGDYPYDVFTAVQAPLAAGSGMEYPGMAVISQADDEYSLDEVIAHEVCHSWFYSAIGSNERRYPFMDESLASSMSDRYMQKYYPDRKLWESYFKNERVAKFFGISELPVQRINELDWLIPASRNIEQPFNLPADKYTSPNYSSMIYNKAAQSFNFLRAYLGDSTFDSALGSYFKDWNGRHPGPEDLGEAFEITGRNLEWFFTDFMTTVKRSDYSISKLKGNTLFVKNKGETTPPFLITMNNAGGHYSSWQEGFQGTSEIDLPSGNFIELIINEDHLMPEMNLLDNNIRKTGLFRKIDLPEPKIFSTVYDPGKHPLFLIPLINWNRADGFMAGLGINNGTLISRKIEYSFIPFYTFGDPGISGRGMIRYNYLPYNKLVRRLSISAEGSRFGFYRSTDYHSLKTGIDLYFRDSDLTNAISKQLSAYFVNVSDINKLGSTEPDNGSKYFFTLTFSAGKTSLVNPWIFRLSTEHASSFNKLLVQMNYRISYYGRDNGLDLGFLTGGMLRNDPVVSLYSLAPSARNGSQLYLFEGDFPDRFSQDAGSFWSRQMFFREGGLVSAVNDSAGYSPFLVSLSVKSTLPGFTSKLPVRPFCNMVYQTHTSVTFHWEAGLSAGLPGLLEFYIPLIVSPEIKRFYPNVKERIRFVFTLESFYRLRPAVN